MVQIQPLPPSSGELAEWFIAPVLKTGEGKTSESSNLSLSLRNVAQLGRALALGASGRTFESCHSDFVINTMQIKKDFLSNGELQKIFDGLQHIYSGNQWAINQNVWHEELLAKVHGVVAIAGFEGEYHDQLEKILRPHLPECNKLMFLYNLWYPYSGLAWHDDGGRKFGATLYLNQEWGLNDGGIFLYKCNQTGEIKGHIPEQNTMVIVDDGELHTVTTVNPAVPEPRMTLQIWGHD